MAQHQPLPVQISPKLAPGAPVLPVLELPEPLEVAVVPVEPEEELVESAVVFPVDDELDDELEPLEEPVAVVVDPLVDVPRGEPVDSGLEPEQPANAPRARSAQTTDRIDALDFIEASLATWARRTAPAIDARPERGTRWCGG